MGFGWVSCPCAAPPSATRSQRARAGEVRADCERGAGSEEDAEEGWPSAGRAASASDGSDDSALPEPCPGRSLCAQGGAGRKYAMLRARSHTASGMWRCCIRGARHAAYARSGQPRHERGRACWQGERPRYMLRMATDHACHCATQLPSTRTHGQFPISNNGCASRQHCGPDSSVRAGLVDERAQAHKHAADVPANGGCTLTAAVVRCSMSLRLVADAAPALASALRRPPLWRAARRVTCGPCRSTSEGAYCGDARCIGCALHGMRMMRTLRLSACGPWETPYAWIANILIAQPV